MAADALRVVTEGRPDVVLPYGFRTAFCAYHKEIEQRFATAQAQVATLWVPG